MIQTKGSTIASIVAYAGLVARKTSSTVWSVDPAILLYSVITISVWRTQWGRIAQSVMSIYLTHYKEQEFLTVDTQCTWHVLKKWWRITNTLVQYALKQLLIWHIIGKCWIKRSKPRSCLLCIATRFGCFATIATRSQRWTFTWLATSAATADRTTPERHRALQIYREAAHLQQTHPTTTYREETIDRANMIEEPKEEILFRGVRACQTWRLPAVYWPSSCLDSVHSMSLCCCGNFQLAHRWVNNPHGRRSCPFESCSQPWFYHCGWNVITYLL